MSPTSPLPFSTRATSPTLPPISTYLLHLISLKQSNLCLSADVTTSKLLLRLADLCGPHISILKTHADIIEDWSPRTAERLQELSTKHRFLIFEDRKFGDIGNTVKMQYQGGVHRIGSWAHIVNAHIFPGPEGVIKSIREASEESLREMCEGVKTEITAGTPPLIGASEDGEDVEEDDGLSRRDDDKDQDSVILTDNNITNDSLSPPLSTSHQSAFLARKSSLVTATTTISQTSEPAPPNPASLARSLSAGESDPQDRDSALSELGPPPHSRGLLLLAEMSSEGNLMTREYTQACLAAARQNRDFVLGFISQRDLNKDAEDEFISMTPGVSLPPEGHREELDERAEDGKGKGDGLGQQYRTPRDVILNDGCDVVIVGRGILNARDPAKEAERYRREAWGAYEERIGRG